MSTTRRTRKIIKGNKSTTHFHDDRPVTTEHLAKNHVAGTGRPMHKLKELLCIPGEKSDGKACHTCEAQCNFGIEYISRKDQEP